MSLCFQKETHAESPSARTIGESPTETQLPLFDGTRRPPKVIEPWRNAWDALGDLDVGAVRGLQVTGKWGDLLPSIPEGQNYLFIHHGVEDYLSSDGGDATGRSS